MPHPSLRPRLEAGETLYTAWATMPDPLVAEFVARSGFDAVTLDMQHGNLSTESAMRGIAAITLAGKPAIVRVPIGRFEMASRALDFGACAVIALMVNTVTDAKAFAAAMKFPPLGERSWGPTRVLALHGIAGPQAYLETANHDTLAIAMIETRAAYSALDDILAVDGIDGVFVGPSDLSNSMGVAPGSPETEAAIQTVLKACLAHKVPCGITASAADMPRRVKEGFRILGAGAIAGGLSAPADAALRAGRAAAN